jgi:hypothetical protein
MEQNVTNFNPTDEQVKMAEILAYSSENGTITEKCKREGVPGSNVSLDTLIKRRYQTTHDHIEILEALKRGKEVVDRQIKNALLKKRWDIRVNL